MLDPRQLECFVAVARTLHFTRAADAIHIAQSALSLQVKRLEEQLGTPLLQRGKRSAVSLTDAGRLFLPEALSALDQLKRTERIGRSIGRGEIGQLDLGYVASAAVSGLLSGVLAQHRSTHPEVAVKVIGMSTPRQIRALVDGLIDVGIIRPRPSYPDNIRSVLVHREPLALIIPSGHFLANLDQVRPEEVASLPFIVPQLDETAGFGDFLRELGAMAGGRIEPAIKVPDFISAIALAAAGYGVVLAPSSFGKMGMNGVVFRHILDFSPAVELAVICRRFDPSPNVEVVMRIAREMNADLRRHATKPFEAALPHPFCS